MKKKYKTKKDKLKVIWEQVGDIPEEEIQRRLKTIFNALLNKTAKKRYSE